MAVEIYQVSRVEILEMQFFEATYFTLNRVYVNKYVEIPYLLDKQEELKERSYFLVVNE
ncbi:35132_t:CDS:2, partial [Gigaspora margarita]